MFQFIRCFCSCPLITSLPDISKWNIEKVEDISSMFNGDINIVLDKTLKLFTDYKLSLSNLKSNEK